MGKARDYKAPTGGKDQPLTIRQMEALRKENIKKTREEMLALELDVLTTPKKPIKSIPKLRAALSTFFSSHMDDPYVTTNELAKALGYADEDALVKDTFNLDNRPEYNALIRKAISTIEDIMTRRMLAISDKAGDTRGYQVALQRMDKKRDKYDPDSAQDNTQVRVNIQMKENESVKNMLDDRLSALLSAQKGSAIDVIPKKIERIQEPVPIEAESQG